MSRDMMDSVVDFPTRGEAFLDKEFTNRHDLFGKCAPYTISIKTDTQPPSCQQEENSSESVILCAFVTAEKTSEGRLFPSTGWYMLG